MTSKDKEYRFGDKVLPRQQHRVPPALEQLLWHGSGAVAPLKTTVLRKEGQLAGGALQEVPLTQYIKTRLESLIYLEDEIYQDMLKRNESKEEEEINKISNKTLLGLYKRIKLHQWTLAAPEESTKAVYEELLKAITNSTWTTVLPKSKPRSSTSSSEDKGKSKGKGTGQGKDESTDTKDLPGDDLHEPGRGRGILPGDDLPGDDLHEPEQRGRDILLGDDLPGDDLREPGRGRDTLLGDKTQYVPLCQHCGKHHRSTCWWATPTLPTAR